MEIELTGLKRIVRQNLWVPALLLIPVVLVLGWLGARYTAADPAGYPLVLNWTEWQIIQAKQVYAAERNTLRHEATGLVDLLNQEPDPVRAQITAERIARSYSKGQPALAYPRELLIAAAAAVQDWSVGALPFEQAQTALQQALDALGSGREQP